MKTAVQNPTGFCGHSFFMFIKKDCNMTAASSVVYSPNIHLYTFPENSVINLDPKVSLDISHVQVDLTKIFRGGIGYGGGSSRTMASAMRDIGHSEGVYNLPYCILACSEANIYKIISSFDEVVENSIISDMLELAKLSGSPIRVNIPIDMDGHASLLSIAISDKSASLKFYDSISNEFLSYEHRYHKELRAFIASLLPQSIQLLKSESGEHKYDVLHLLSQGGPGTSGCGYYALYTALLLKERPDLRALESFKNAPLYDQKHDTAIRADLVVRTLLSRGLDPVVLSGFHLTMYRNNHVFERIGPDATHLIKQLQHIERIQKGCVQGKSSQE